MTPTPGTRVNMEVGWRKVSTVGIFSSHHRISPKTLHSPKTRGSSSSRSARPCDNFAGKKKEGFLFSSMHKCGSPRLTVKEYSQCVVLWRLLVRYIF